MTDQGGPSALRPQSRALLKRIVRAAGEEPAAILDLRDDLSQLDDAEIESLWNALKAEQGRETSSDDAPYRVVDKARRKLLVPADQFQDMLLAKIADEGGAPPPEENAKSLKALVEAFESADRADEIAAAAQALVRERSLAYDIT